MWSDFIKFDHEIDKLKSILYKNIFPRDLVDKCIKKILDKILAPKPAISTITKKDLVIALPYLGQLSSIIGEVNKTTFFFHKTYFKSKTHKTITSN